VVPSDRKWWGVAVQAEATKKANAVILGLEAEGIAATPLSSMPSTIKSSTPGSATKAPATPQSFQVCTTDYTTPSFISSEFSSMLRHWRICC